MHMKDITLDQASFIVLKLIIDNQEDKALEFMEKFYENN